MADETIELTEVQEVLDGLSSPTDEQFVQAVRDYSDGAVASAAAKLAMAGGGGGGGAGPDFITPVTVTPSADSTQAFTVSNAAESFVFVVDTDNGLVRVANNMTLETPAFETTTDGNAEFFGELMIDGPAGFNGVAPSVPEIPATPNAQDIADVLVALGLVTQAA